MAVGIALALVAWPLFALAMRKHQPALLVRELPRPVPPLLRLVGWGLLGASLFAFATAKGASQGTIFWGATLVLTAIVWVLLLTFLPHRAVTAMLGLGLVALVVLQ